MSEEMDPLRLADELADIARTTRDPVTAQRLMSLVARLMEQAGLPPDEAGGGEPPNPWVCEPVCDPA